MNRNIQEINKTTNILIGFIVTRMVLFILFVVFFVLINI